MRTTTLVNGGHVMDDNKQFPAAEGIRIADAASARALRDVLHELRQPLNNIQLATILLRNRTAPLLHGDEQEYLLRRLDRVEQQIARAVGIADKLSNAAACDELE